MGKYHLGGKARWAGQQKNNGIALRQCFGIQMFQHKTTLSYNVCPWSMINKY